ncbi:MAG: hypothetical protein A3B70_00945 [Deltaproteobacteria bacterium RIFCSPHIGHO2_02_FULL_40_11]|nr:MAG: hypothetical protein A3B70_00945 [Deltaproteobacteria bacterium RIFCSPHIGHO2_02_FULL_40_11]
MRGTGKQYFLSFFLICFFLLPLPSFSQVTEEDIQNFGGNVIEAATASVLKLHAEVLELEKSQRFLSTKTNEETLIRIETSIAQVAALIEEKKPELDRILKGLRATQVEALFFLDTLRRWSSAMDLWHLYAEHLLRLNQEMDQQLDRLNKRQKNFDDETQKILKKPSEVSPGGIILISKADGELHQKLLEGFNPEKEEIIAILKNIKANRQQYAIELVGQAEALGGLCTLFSQGLLSFWEDAEYRKAIHEVMAQHRVILEEPVLEEAQILFDQITDRIADAIVTKIVLRGVQDSVAEALAIHDAVIEFLDPDMLQESVLNEMIRGFVYTRPALTLDIVRPFVVSLLRGSLKK